MGTTVQGRRQGMEYPKQRVGRTRRCTKNRTHVEATTSEETTRPNPAIRLRSKSNRLHTFRMTQRPKVLNRSVHNTILRVVTLIINMSLWLAAGRNISKYLKLRNLQRARLISSAKYAYGKGKRVYDKYNELSPTHKAFISNVYRQARARAATITNKRRMRPALIRAGRRRTYKPRPMPVSRYAGRDIRILRRAKHCFWKRSEWSLNDPTTHKPILNWVDGTSTPTDFPVVPSLKTIRTYYGDTPWQFDVSKFIGVNTLSLVASDASQSSIDVQSIQFNFTFINYQPDVDMRVRIILLRQVREQQADQVPQDSHSDTLPDYWQDPVDKHERHNFDTAFTETDFDPNFKDYSPPSKRWKVWMSKVVTVRSNPHSPNFLVTTSPSNVEDGYRTNMVISSTLNNDTAAIDNNYGPNMTNPDGTASAQKYDMHINRIRGYPGQNERKVTMTWAPKGGYRFQWIDPDTSIVGEDNSKVPKDDIRLLILPFEDTKDVSRKATQHELGYRFEANLKFKDLL